MFRIVSICVIALSGLAITPASAQSYPAKPLRFIVGFAPGGAPDTMTRIFADRLPAALGQPIVVENRPAAGGLVAAENVSKAPADGYMLLSTATASFVPALVKNVPYDPINDFAGIAPLANIHAVVVTGPSTNFKSLKELIVFAKANPGKLTFGSSGAGTATHLSGVLFQHMTGVEFLHVPYRGVGPATTGLLGEQIDMLFAPVVIVPHIASGKIRAVGVTTAKRSPLFPDIPTIAETGLPGYESLGWFGVFAPAKTPGAIVDRISADIGKVLVTPESKRILNDQGAEPEPNSAPVFAAFVNTEVKKWLDLAKAANIKLSP